MSNLDNDSGRQAIRERLSRGERPETIAYENGLGWADEAVVHDEARKRAAWQSGPSSRRSSGSSASSSSGNGAFAGIVMLIGLAIFAINAVYTWLANNPAVVYGLGAALVLIPVTILIVRFFLTDDKDPYGYQTSPYNRWVRSRNRTDEQVRKYQDLLSKEVEKTPNTVEQVTDVFLLGQCSTAYKEFNNHVARPYGSPSYDRKKYLRDVRDELLKRPEFQDRPDLHLLFCIARALAHTYRPGNKKTSSPRAECLKKALILEVQERGTPRLAKDIRRILKRV